MQKLNMKWVLYRINGELSIEKIVVRAAKLKASQRILWKRSLLEVQLEKPAI